MATSGAPPSSKALQTTRLVVQNKDRAYSAHFNLQSPLMTIDPNTNVLDIYGRNAHPYSLRQEQPGGMYPSGYNNVSQRLIVESNLAPYISYNMKGGNGYQYDTMGAARANYNKTFPNSQFPVYRGMAATSPQNNPCGTVNGCNTGCGQANVGQQRVGTSQACAAFQSGGAMFAPSVFN